ncbi:NAD(P)-dependent oxidoreductase [Sporosarcina soli]|uniref:NAD(P)-dependent oxidoreductase n=1 Tax=Sporosarcina soli TaxID=334736 RepID=A0ABW0TLQ8_9BACL
MTTIGIIGCGLMGKGITKCYVGEQYKVVVYDPDLATVEWIKQNGAIAAASLQELSSEASIVIASLPTVDIVNDSFLGENGVFNTIQEGAVIIDMSTTDADTAIQLANQAKRKNLYYFDSPVSGGPDGANNGTLTLMIGGDRDKFEEIKPILRVVGKDLHYLGESGNGQIAKLCNNMIVSSMILSLGEAFITAEKAGLSREKLSEVLSTGSATKVFEVFGQNIIQKEYENVLFSLNHMHKDLSLYMKTAASFASPSFLGSLSYQLFEAAKATGKGFKDTTSAIEVIESLS